MEEKSNIQSQYNEESFQENKYKSPKALSKTVPLEQGEDDKNEAHRNEIPEKIQASTLSKEAEQIVQKYTNKKDKQDTSFESKSSKSFRQEKSSLSNKEMKKKLEKIEIKLKI